uniref:C2H2-type domain-containing protein n=1 Tax=Panagrolaimus davidi TaxID=227884 RepID=A0A914PS53_9BILA
MDALQFPQQIFGNSDDMSLEQDEIVLGNGEQYTADGVFPFGEDYKQPMSATPRAVHQCNICNKIFVSFKGLQQHAIIHTDQKPFTCEICNKSFRFKSNLFEHRSVHSGFTPHACPYCGKTCRLKGNLKKHLKTHVTTKEELDEAWKPFASNRRPPAEVPHDAIIVRSTGEPMFTPPARPRKRKLGLGNDARSWIEKIGRGDILPTGTLQEKLDRFRDMLKMLESNGTQLKTMLNHARTIAFEKFECPMCKGLFHSPRVERPMFCEICLKSFVDRKSLEQHESYHKRVHLLVESGELELNDPEILVPSIEDDVDNSVSDQNEQIQNQMPQLQNSDQMPQIKYDDSVPVSTDPAQIQEGQLFSHDPSQNEDGQLF